MWEWGSCLICTDPSSHTMPDLYRLGRGPHAVVWNLVPQVIIWGTRTWKLMVQTHSCQPGLRVWLSQKGIQGKQSASKYKLRVGDFFLLPYGFLRGRSEGKVKSGSSWWDKPSVPQDVLEFWSNYFVPSAVLLQDWALCQGEIAQRLKHTLTGTRDQVIC